MPGSRAAPGRRAAARNVGGRAPPRCFGSQHQHVQRATLEEERLRVGQAASTNAPGMLAATWGLHMGDSAASTTARLEALPPSKRPKSTRAEDALKAKEGQEGPSGRWCGPGLSEVLEEAGH